MSYQINVILSHKMSFIKVLKIQFENLAFIGKAALLAGILAYLLPYRIQAQFLLSGDATDIGSNCYQLTADRTFESGSVFSSKAIDLTKDFTIRYRLNFGDHDANGADGIAFVMVADSTQLLGVSGGDMGYGGMTNCLVVEMDTYQNNSNQDPSADHIALIIGGNPNHNLNNTLNRSSLAYNIEDGNYHDAVFYYDAKNKYFSVFFDCEFIFGLQGDLPLIFFNGSKKVFWGFTASTGGQTNAQLICPKPDFTWVDAMADEVYCLGSQVQLNGGNGGISYHWSPEQFLNDPNIRNPIANINQTTTFILEKIDQCGNLTLDSVKIEIIPNSIQLDLGPDTALCEGQNILLSVNTSNANYLWNTGESTQQIQVSTEGIYSVHVDDGVCEKSDTIIIVQSELPPLLMFDPLEGCQEIGIIIDLDSLKGKYGITWPDGTHLSSFKITNSGTFQVSLNNSCGNVNSLIEADLFICRNFYVPNAFSPNFDGINDRWGPISETAIVKISQMSIFNRWGDVVFSTKNIEPKEQYYWDGTFNGKSAEIGVYAYFIELELLSGEVVTVKGDVTLVR